MTEKKQQAGSDSPHLEDDEQEQAAQHSSPRALVIHEIVREEGETALKRTVGALVWSSLAAGLSMGFSFLTQATLQSGLPDAPWSHLVSSFGYCIGFVIVILGREQLFTESTLTAVLPVLTNRNISTLLRMFRLWGIVLVANLAGTFLFALLLTTEGVLRPEVVAALRTLSADAVVGTFWPVLVKAVLAGWLIALMVWLLPSARSARLLTIVVITYVVALCRLSHIIAGSVEVAYQVVTGQIPMWNYVSKFVAPTLLGNIIGGVSLVALLNHAAVVSEIGTGKDGEAASAEEKSKDN